MSEKLQLTASQRAAGVDRLGENLSVRSGAGAGKTLVLAHRFTELIMADPEANPLPRFVALTFTDKAALEMTQRVRRMLTDRAGQSKGASRQKLLSWLAELPEARISTIHSFCASLLRTHAITAGVDPNFAVCADTLLTAAMQAEAADQAVLRAVQEDRPDVLELLASIDDYGKMVQLVDRLLTWRTECNLKLHADPAASLELWRKAFDTSRARLRSQLQADVELHRALEELRAAECTDTNDKLLPLRDQAIAAAQKLLAEPDNQAAEPFAQLAAIKPGSLGSAKAWQPTTPKQIRDGIKVLKEIANRYAVLAEPLGDADELAARSLATLVKLARQANDLFADQKRKRGLLDFTDLMDYTWQLLAVDESLTGRLRSGIGQLLIDECQDTNSFQLRMLLGLLFGTDQPEDWPEGKLFVVGDAKQSIYRFRGAQVEVFEDLCRKLGPSRLEKLDISFRTHEAGIEFVNHLFDRLMDGYEPIRASRDVNPPGPSVEILLATDPQGRQIEGQSSAPADAAQAAATAQRIAEMLQGEETLVWDEQAQAYRPAQAGDIAVLFGRRTKSLLYQRELARREIPYYVLAGTGFFRRQEVFDVLNALRAIDDPFDDIAFFGVLRSSLVGLDDDALLHISLACERPYLPDLADRLNKGTDHESRIDLPGLDDYQQRSLGFAVDLLVRLGRRKDAVSIAALIEELAEQTGYEAALLSQFEGKRMLGNFRRIVALARQADAGQVTLAQFIAQMNQRTLENLRFEQAAVAGEAENVVRLMTIHNAKGMEFPIVFLPDLNAKRDPLKDALINRLDFGLTFKCQLHQDRNGQADADTPEMPVSYRLARQLEQADQAAEDIRKLYVAATRHQDHLVFVGADWRTKDGAFRPSSSVISQMDRALGIAETIDAGRGRIIYGDGRFAAAVRRMTPATPKRRRKSKSEGEKMLAASSGPAELAEQLLRPVEPAAGAPALLGRLDVSVGRVELAATALSDFAHCPTLYRWRHELRVPANLIGQKAEPGDVNRPLEAATLGTLLHRCMELLDLACPQAAERLVRQALGEMDLTGSVDAAPLAAELQQMLQRFFEHELSGRLRRSPRQFRELDFILSVGPAVIRGQIDLLYQDPAGDWHIVDYKSDRVEPAQAGEHARMYSDQLLLYSAAAGRILSAAPATAELYFLRPGIAQPVRPPTGTAGMDRIEHIARQLIAARREGKFARRSDDHCSYCPYGKLCQVQSGV